MCVCHLQYLYNGTLVTIPRQASLRFLANKQEMVENSEIAFKLKENIYATEIPNLIAYPYTNTYTTALFVRLVFFLSFEMENLILHPKERTYISQDGDDE